MVDTKSLHKLTDRLLDLLGDRDAFSLEISERSVYAYDNSRRESVPDAVAFPSTHEHAQGLVVLCRELRIPLTARGRGTNTTGASVPVAGGIVASFERMNRILRIDPDNRLAVVEPGVLNADLQAALKPHGFFWAPDPTSAQGGREQILSAYRDVRDRLDDTIRRRILPLYG